MADNLVRSMSTRRRRNRRRAAVSPASVDDYVSTTTKTTTTDTFTDSQSALFYLPSTASEDGYNTILWSSRLQSQIAVVNWLKPYLLALYGPRTAPRRQTTEPEAIPFTILLHMLTTATCLWTRKNGLCIVWSVLATITDVSPSWLMGLQRQLHIPPMWRLPGSLLNALILVSFGHRLLLTLCRYPCHIAVLAGLSIQGMWKICPAGIDLRSASVSCSWLTVGSCYMSPVYYQY